MNWNTPSPLNNMKLSEDYNLGTNIIRAYQDGVIEVNNKPYDSSLIISNTLLIPDWGVKHIDEINDTHWQQLIEPAPEVILIGTGNNLQFPHPSSYQTVIQSGIGIEFMDSQAACRTYNILLSEDRFVMAGIIL